MKLVEGTSDYWTWSRRIHCGSGDPGLSRPTEAWRRFRILFSFKYWLVTTSFTYFYQTHQFRTTARTRQPTPRVPVPVTLQELAPGLEEKSEESEVEEVEVQR